MSNTFPERIAIFGTLVTYAVLIGGTFFILLALLSAPGSSGSASRSLDESSAASAVK
jgi:hypothetical protein